MSLFGLATGLATKTAANAAKKAASNVVKKSSSSGSGSQSSTTSKSPTANMVADLAGSALSAVKNTGVLGNAAAQNVGTGKTIADYQAAWKQAQAAGDTAGMAEAHAGAEALRKQQGYSGGADGSQKIPMTYSYKDSDNNVRSSSNNTDYARMYMNYMNSNDLDGAQGALDSRYLKLGTSGSEDSWQSMAQSLLDSKRAQQQAAQLADSYKGMLDDYSGKAQAIRDEQSALVQQNIAALNAQRPLVQQAGAQANQAAQQSYYQTINPNGVGAEQRAALGLSDSGLTETAQIAAANAYQGAVNSNAQNVNSQLAQIDLAIQNAKLSGDIATAQQLQSFYDSVLSAGMQAAQSVLGAQQWALGNAQDLRQQNIQNAYTQAGITGQYNGQQTLSGQQATLEFRNMDLANQRAALELMIQQRYGLDQAAADLYLTQMQAAGQNYQNIYQNLQNQYAQRMI